MNGLHDNYVLLRVQAAVQDHGVHHYVGTTIENLIKEIETLTAKFKDINNDLEAGLNLSKILELEKQIHTLMNVARLSKEANLNRLKNHR